MSSSIRWRKGDIAIPPVSVMPTINSRNRLTTSRRMAEKNRRLGKGIKPYYLTCKPCFVRGHLVFWSACTSGAVYFFRVSALYICIRVRRSGRLRESWYDGHLRRHRGGDARYWHALLERLRRFVD